MVDRGLVLRKISELDEYQQQLQEFKGITVQQYRDEKIDPEIIVGILKKKLGDFNQFKKAVVGFVQNPQNLK
jgi:uncharacterized protein YutE (UPF0331/DUF86 family)